MTFQERYTWLQAVIVLVVPGWYFWDVLDRVRATPVADIAYQPVLLWNVGIVIVATVAATVASTVAAHVGAEVAREVASHTGRSAGAAGRPPARPDVERRDERDASIERYGGYVAGMVLGVGVLVPLGLAMVEAEPFWIAQALYASLVTSVLASSAVKIVAYRRGF